MQAPLTLVVSDQQREKRDDNRQRAHARGEAAEKPAEGLRALDLRGELGVGGGRGEAGIDLGHGGDGGAQRRWR